MNFTKIKVSSTLLQKSMNWFFCPWIGAGIKLESISSDFRQARVVMPLRLYNRNFVGTHYGGSLYSMVDPMYMLMLLNILGTEFIVWDMAAKIQYKRPGKKAVYADFVIEDDLLDMLYALKPDEKKIFDLPVDIKSLDTDEVIASAIKTTYVKRKAPNSERSKL
ncbi:protein of unknown function DUF4442 containing protein [Nitzschia inconspicua]|uniref:DUF4442 domain-containing protein n=1 Tax=Nitzschia inconspicua TaxID=303405 RepID=A0A9K3PD25_9STRA|nr:protein of unknown function DUF4442 containing protein [Nitzschia inconspicua]